MIMLIDELEGHCSDKTANLNAKNESKKSEGDSCFTHLSIKETSHFNQDNKTYPESKEGPYTMH